jgi:hypothetical protein
MFLVTAQYLQVISSNLFTLFFKRKPVVNLGRVGIRRPERAFFVCQSAHFAIFNVIYGLYKCNASKTIGKFTALNSNTDVIILICWCYMIPRLSIFISLYTIESDDLFLFEDTVLNLPEP